jgi:hypothetical protein
VPAVDGLVRMCVPNPDVPSMFTMNVIGLHSVTGGEFE